ncbi:MAG: N-acetylmuramoyl-L-alanine amidase [Bacteroidales bacterium]
MSLRKINNFKSVAILIALLLVSMVAKSQDKYDTARDGDGIYSLLRRNNISPYKYVNNFIELNKGILGKNNSLFVGRKYKLPNVSNSAQSDSESTSSVAPNRANSTRAIKTYSIFGKYKNIEIVDNALSGAAFYLVGGHGGPDPGAIGKYNGSSMCEDEYAYDVTLRLGRELISHGAAVYIITRDRNDGIRDEAILPCDKDEYCYPNSPIPRNHVRRLKQRANAVNNIYTKNKSRYTYHRAIMIHVDSRSTRHNADVFFYYAGGSTKGRSLCLNLQGVFNEKYDEHQPGRGYHGTVSMRNLYMLKNTTPVASYIELANINHKRDQQRLVIENNRQALANWLAEGVIKDFNNNKR